MGILDDVMNTLGATRVPRKPALLTELIELLNAAGQDLVDVCLMSGVPDHHVLRRPKNAMERDAQFDDPEVRSKVASGRRHLLDEEGPDLLSESRHLLDRQGANIIGSADSAEQTHSRSLPGEARSGARCDVISSAAASSSRAPRRLSAQHLHDEPNLALNVQKSGALRLEGALRPGKLVGRHHVTELSSSLGIGTTCPG